MQDKRLQAWNRMQMVSNVREDVGTEGANKYMANFNKEEVKSIYILALAVQKFGAEMVRASVNKGVACQQ